MCVHARVHVRTAKSFAVEYWCLVVQKLKQIEELKQRQAEGQALEQNQVPLHGTTVVPDVPLLHRVQLLHVDGCSMWTAAPCGWLE